MAKTVELDGTTTRHVGKRLSKTSNVLCHLIMYVGYKSQSHIKRRPKLGARDICPAHSHSVRPVALQKPKFLRDCHRC